jgi:hypothetical protein
LAAFLFSSLALRFAGLPAGVRSRGRRDHERADVARVFAKMTVPEMTLTSNHELDCTI